MLTFSFRIDTGPSRNEFQLPNPFPHMLVTKLGSLPNTRCGSSSLTKAPANVLKMTSSERPFHIFLQTYVRNEYFFLLEIMTPAHQCEYSVTCQNVQCFCAEHSQLRLKTGSWQTPAMPMLRHRISIFYYQAHLEYILALAVSKTVYKVSELCRTQCSCF